MVSIHAPTRGATVLLQLRCLCTLFQSTHPRGVRRVYHGVAKATKMFQSTHPRGVRHLFGSYLISFHKFQSTHPRGVRQVMRLRRIGRIEFQSTHPRGVRLHLIRLSFSNLPVSIHAPTRGATAPPLFGSIQSLSFNPRTHEGCDIAGRHRHAGSTVSIHAPTRGATITDLYHPRPVMFQSTHPRGVRLEENGYNANSFSFQSTHPRGVRRCISLLILRTWVSIHAPTRGATAYSAKYRILIYKSSHFANINQTITFKVIKSLEFL